MFRYYIKIVRKFFKLKVTSASLLVAMTASLVLWYALYLSFPMIAAMIVDALTAKDFELAFMRTGLFLAAGIAYVVSGHIHHRIYTTNSIYIHDCLQNALLKKVVAFDEAFTQNIQPAFVVDAAFSDIQNVIRIPDQTIQLIMEALSMIVTVVILAVANIYIGAAALSLCLLSFFVMSGNAKKRDYYIAEQRKHQDSIAGLIGQTLEGNREVNAFNMENDLNQYLEKFGKSWKRAYFKRRKYHNNISVLVPMIFDLGKIGVYTFLAFLILNGRYELGALVFVIGYFEKTTHSFNEISKILNLLSRNAVRVDRLAAIFDYKTKNMQRFGESRLDEIKGKIEFKEVSFKYEKQETMKNMSFEIAANSFVAIVGKSGCGKSTIFRILLRLYKANKGLILLDDQNIYDYSSEIYARNVSIVTQKPFVFDMTIRENLSLVDANQDRQIEACKKAGIHNYIMSLPETYNTKMLRDGENISAGQKQLLALARTLLSGAEVLLFDEVTSALDVESSMKVMRVIRKLKKEHTILMITHKPELMRMADEIMVIDRGRLVGRGKHRELLAKNKYYQKLQQKST